MVKRFPYISVLFTLSIAIMVAVVISGARLPIGDGLPIIIASIVTIGVFSIIGLIEDSFLKFFTWSCVIQVAYFFLDFGAATAIGKTPLFASVQLINYTIAGGVFAFIILAMYYALGRPYVHNYAGLYRKNPKLTLALVIACLSLGGLPAFNIFVGEFLMYSILVEIAPVLAMAAIFASLLCFIFYFRLCFTMFSGKKDVVVNFPAIPRLTTAILTALIVILGIVPHILLKILNMIAGV
jgi:formate hydrogenlyase subunit 3/multisubunit Na+/H+ antiporter MnhD subunit